MLHVQTPIIPAVAELIRIHRGTISLGQGVAFYGPPARAAERIGDFLSDPENHKYAPVEGTPRLIELIVQKLQTENAVSCDEKRRVVVTAGANMGFLHALMAIADPGDEIVLPLPYYFNQEMAIRMLNCIPIAVPTDERYQLKLDLIRQAITPKTRAIVTISPNNPSGAVYPAAALREVNSLCREHGLYHLSDEAYENFTYGEARHLSPGSLPGSEAHTISLYSFSKAYGFASWRIGYMVLPEHLYDSVLKAQDTNLICAPLISQYAAIGALEEGSRYCSEKLATIRGTRAIVLDALGRIDEICITPQTEGALYVFIKLRSHLHPMQVVEKLITQYRVAVIPGTTFGMECGCYLRVSFGALDPDTAREGAARLVTGMQAIVAGH